MYIPEYFHVRDHEDAIKFMRANPFAILISSTEAGPFATHLPIFVRAEKGKRKLSSAAMWLRLIRTGVISNSSRSV